MKLSTGYRTLALASLILVCACATASMTAFHDPAYANRSYRKLAVFAVGMYLQNAVQVEKQVCEKVAPAKCVQGKAILPPTRIYSNEEVSQYLAKAGVDGVLIIALADDQSVSRYRGTITSSNATTNGIGIGQVIANGNTGLIVGVSQSAATSRTISTPVYACLRRESSGTCHSRLD